MGRWSLFAAGFRQGWRDVTPAERERVATIGILAGGGAALFVIVFILSN